MNKAAIEKFAKWARIKLISDITYKAGMIGITENGIAKELPQSTADLKFFDIGTKEYAEVSGKEIIQRNALIKTIEQRQSSYPKYKDAFENVVEEVAYTWFNRLIAIRFMEVNDYIPSGIRVLSSENNAKNEPDLVTNPFDSDLEYTPYEKDRIIQLKDENKLDEAFRMLFIKQCNSLHNSLPELFEKTEDYSELLLNISFTDIEGIVYHLVHDIEEDDFNIEKEGQIEIIGWMYQYYIAQKHDEIINIYKGTVKKSDIPAATQLFTTDWVVRYMVDNSLGRYWIERNPNSTLKEKLEFFVTPKNGEITHVNESVEPIQMTFFDPCMGSGHILVYAFDVLMEIYREYGYSDRDAAISIVENNIFGLDIDKRAYQLSYFAIMMKARQYNRRALTKNIKCNLAKIEESNGIESFYHEGLTTDKAMNKIGEYLVEVYRNAEEIGSLQSIESKDYEGFECYLNSLENTNSQFDIFALEWLQYARPTITKLINQAKIMSNKYAAVVTNPPYMGKLEGHLKTFLLDNFKDYSGDLFSAFVKRNFDYCLSNAYAGFMTPFVWMFIKTYEKLREYIINNKNITTLIQMEYSAYEEATVPICSYVLKNAKTTDKSLCFRLSDFTGGMKVQKCKVLEGLKNKDCGYFYETSQKNFKCIKGSPIAYWLSDTLLAAFEGEDLGEVAKPRQGLATGENDRFLRLWNEVNFNKVGFNCESRIEAVKSKKKWFPCNKGGSFRRWYGNNDFIVNWENDGYEIRNFKDDKGKLKSRPQNIDYYFKEGMTWSTISSSSLSMRYSPKGFMFETKGSVCFANNHGDLHYLLALMNTPVISEVLKALSPTLDFHEGPLSRVPVIIDHKNKEMISTISRECTTLSKTDWDSYETSWDFEEHPLVRLQKSLWDVTAVGASMQYYYGNHPKVSCPLELCYMLWQGECNERFNMLKNNEEELNKIFIEIYGLQDELSPEVEAKNVTVDVSI